MFIVVAFFAVVVALVAVTANVYLYVALLAFAAICMLLVREGQQHPLIAQPARKQGTIPFIERVKFIAKTVGILLLAAFAAFIWPIVVAMTFIHVATEYKVKPLSKW